MKTFKISIFILFAVLTLVGCNKTNNTADKNTNTQENTYDNAKNNGRVDPKPDAVPSTDTKDKSSTGTEETKIALATIQCSTCKKTITKALKTDAGIKDFNINVDAKIVTVNYDKSKTSLDKIEGIITSAGYDANDKKADPKAYDKLESCCKVPEKKNK